MHTGNIYDSADRLTRRRVNLNRHPLLDDDGLEVPVYNSGGQRIPRREPLVDPDEPKCGVLMDLKNIEALFTPETHLDDFDSSSDISGSNDVSINVYPLAFLRSFGNLQATGIPYCFYPFITSINRSVRRVPHEDPLEFDDASDRDSDSVDLDDPQPSQSGTPVVRPISCQFYNYSAHRTASRAGAHDSQQATVTAALAGVYARSASERSTASQARSDCDTSLPSERFHTRISQDNCPTACRAEFVYSVDVRALADPSGT